MKKAFSTLLHVLELAICAIGVAISGNLLISALALLVAFIPANKLRNDIKGDYINDSIFSASRDGEIVQNAFAKPFKVINLLLSKDKSLDFRKEALNMFVQLRRTDEKGNLIQYKTKSHLLTYKLLERLQRAGYIDKLEKEIAGKSRLVLENLGIGNIKKMLSGRKTTMFNIRFYLTDKERNKEEIMDLVTGNKKENTSIVSDSTNSINEEMVLSEIEKKREQLMSLKRELEEKKDAIVEDDTYTGEIADADLDAEDRKMHM